MIRSLKNGSPMKTYFYSFKRTALRAVAVFSFAAIAFANISFDTQSSNGQAGYTGSPGEVYCTNCHTGTALNGGGGSVVIGGAPATYTLEPPPPFNAVP